MSWTIGGSFFPIIRVRLQSTLMNRWISFYAYVDSGASFSIFSDKVATRLGLNFYDGELEYVLLGNGARIPIYLHRLSIGIGQEELSAAIGFSEELGVGFNLLGRKDVFDQLEFCFRDGAKKLLVISEG